MEIITLPLGYLGTNCYLLEGSEGFLVIDPAGEPEQVLTVLGGRKLCAILLTHGHFDHVGGVKALAEQTGCAVYLHEADLSLPQSITAGPLYYTHAYDEGDSLTLAGLTFRVLHTPGHTPGSVCLMFEKDLFCGDTLFRRSIGRTDLPGGSMPIMAQTLRRLARLEGNYRVWPGHGESTALAEEKGYNPYLRGIQ